MPEVGDGPFTLNSLSAWARREGHAPAYRPALRLAIAAGELRARLGAGGQWFVEFDDAVAFFRRRAEQRQRQKRERVPA